MNYLYKFGEKLYNWLFHPFFSANNSLLMVFRSIYSNSILISLLSCSNHSNLYLWGRLNLKTDDAEGLNSNRIHNWVINPELPVSKFKNQFDDLSDKTFVTVISEYASEECLQQVIQMGMKEGLTLAFENLDSMLEKMNAWYNQK